MLVAVTPGALLPPPDEPQAAITAVAATAIAADATNLVTETISTPSRTCSNFPDVRKPNITVAHAVKVKFVTSLVGRLKMDNPAGRWSSQLDHGGAGQ